VGIEMREYILHGRKKVLQERSDYLLHGSISVEIHNQLPESVSLPTVLKKVESLLPRKYFSGLKKIMIKDLDEFKERGINALYHEGVLYITSDQDGEDDLIDDIVHEIGHHLETTNVMNIYADGLLEEEFLKKRKELHFELHSEGYETPPGFLSNLKYDENIDNYLYKRIGYSTLRSFGLGIFLGPYSATSLREYFANGFAAFYLGQMNDVKDVSPRLYKKIVDLHNSEPKQEKR
jgi:hypothetical protein